MYENTDENLVNRMKKGDRQAFDEFYAKYHERVISAAYGVLHNKQDALDVAQDVFVKIYCNIDRYRALSSLYTWVYRVTVNMAIDSLRKKSKAKESELNTEFQSNFLDGDFPMPIAFKNQPDRLFEDRECMLVIKAAMDKLSEKHRTVIVLREIEDLSYAEIAEALDISIGTVMSRLFHARKILQKEISESFSDAFAENDTE